MRLRLRRHRHWLILIPLAGLTLAVAALIGYHEVERASKGPVFDLAATCIRTNPVARVQLGVITGFGIAVDGGVVENTDGTGHASIDFSVHGSSATGHATVDAVLQNGRWRLTGGLLAVAGALLPLPLDRPIIPNRGPNLRNLCARPSSTTRFPKS
ncbi:MAG TPA: cytochrome c oxidase assembly factor Coa1 family protein [Gaiellales bacterium]|nr:cytochrome c oxidase assembly factor Coa1 family protein [Gaiellales bacterium]